MKSNIGEIITSIYLITIVTAATYRPSPQVTDPRNSALSWLLNSLGREINFKLDNEKSQPPSNDVISLKTMLSEEKLPNSDMRVTNKVTIPVFSNVGHARTSPLVSALLSNQDSGNDVDVTKRQGNWDYDYGLGGGRFGKRSHSLDFKRGYADYSLGGGRFGRDVSHVTDLNDGEEGEEDVTYDDVDG